MIVLSLVLVVVVYYKVMRWFLSSMMRVVIIGEGCFGCGVDCCCN